MGRCVSLIELLKDIQLDIMLVLTGICAVMVIFVLISKVFSTQRKSSLLMMTIGSMFLLIFDRFAYVYRGDTSVAGWWMVRISNYFVFALTLFMIFSFNQYLKDLYLTDGNAQNVNKRLYIVDVLFGVGLVLVTISQFTGFYYTFDETNHYVRSHGFVLCYLIPMLMWVLQSSTTISYRKHLSIRLFTGILLFSSLPVVASLFQVVFYGLSFTNITLVGLVVMLYIIAISDVNEKVSAANQREIDLLIEEQQTAQTLFEQTAEALVNAIDAKDRYTHGHSTRVAEYSEKIARLSGMDEDQCREIYFAALLHDVGKIGIKDSIINKEGRLTDEEYNAIKQHTVIGKSILSSISKSPYLSIGANSHHERYDGKGYPEGLKGDDIPQIARIIAVADAYDAMTSKRSYRDPIPQQKVREEIIKCSGTQFDPQYARIMLHLIDLDSEYIMKERDEIRELAGRNELKCEEYGSAYSEGILITRNETTITLKNQTDKDHLNESSLPSLILFDSLDARIHESDKKAEEMSYTKYAVIRADGHHECGSARKVSIEITDKKKFDEIDYIEANVDSLRYTITAVKYKDHILLTIDNELRTIRFTVALVDATRYAYLCLTGEYCYISDVDIDKSEQPVSNDYIPRIAELISYIDSPAGDIPNVQIDGWRTEYSESIPVEGNIVIRFHAKSLPTARLIWHCPFLSLFSSFNGRFDSPDCRELTLVRLDGESWETDKHVYNKLHVTESEEFESWNDWKARNKEGVDCEIRIDRDGDKIHIEAYDAGIHLVNTLIINDDIGTIYAALTGDQVALTDIRISHI